MDEDGFTRVTAKSRRRARPGHFSKKHGARSGAAGEPRRDLVGGGPTAGDGSQQQAGGPVIDVPALVSEITALADAIGSSVFHDSLLSKLQPFLGDAPANGGGEQRSEHAGAGGLLAEASAASRSLVDAVDVVAYGVGPFGVSAVSRYQLAEAMALHRWLCAMINAPGSVSAPLLFDPILGPSEVEVAAKLGFDVIPENEQGRHLVSRRTIFFMPHCDLHLYNNLLASNWGRDSLPKLLVLGNR